MKRTHIVTDETGALEKFDVIVDALTQYRGHGVRLTMVFQSPSQLRACFVEGVDQTILANSSHIFFGVNDLGTAEQISKRIGERTIVKESGGTTTGGSTQSSQGPQQSYSTGGTYGSSESWDQTGRSVLKADEVMNLDPRDAICFTPGSRPIFTRLIPFYEAPWLGMRPGILLRTMQAGMILICSATVLAVTLAIAIHLTAMLDQGDKPQRTKPAQRAPHARFR
jgi:type IV secretion system protein VirD4